jgi:S-DNA-T family DNA segregation ATPase FtsK/SpoIIIE
VLTQLAVFHAPDDLIIAVCAGEDAPPRGSGSSGCRTTCTRQTDALGPVRLVASTGPDMEKLLEDVIGNRPRFSPTAGGTSTPHVVLVLDGVDLKGATQLDDGIDGVTVLDLDEKPPRLLDRSLLVLDVRAGAGGQRELHTYGMDHAADVGTPDRLSTADAEAVARRLAPLRLAAISKSADTPLSAELGLADLLGIADPETFNVTQGWLPRPNRDKLRVPIGVGADGATIELDLKESAQDGMGPHGLLIGATGSGKSELLRTLVLALAATHSSETLNFVWSTSRAARPFASLDRLPHTAAVITNLADELPLVDRMSTRSTASWSGGRSCCAGRATTPACATTRRRGRRARAAAAAVAAGRLRRVLRAAVRQARTSSTCSSRSDGWAGRSGVHLLLASQRLEEGRLRGLDTHLSYRIGLRTFSALESRAVLGVPDAYELPRSPGHGYLKFGTEPMVRFRAAYVSGILRKAGARGAGAAGTGEAPQVLAYSTRYVPKPAPVTSIEPRPEEVPAGESLLDVMVDRLAGQGPPAHQVWLPPLNQSAALDELLGPVAADPVRGLAFANPELHGALQVPIALIDKPREQLRDVMWLQLAGAAGHVAIVGSTLAGKSTAVRTLICGLALTHTPAEVQVYCLDFGGGSLTGVKDLPHVGGVSGRLDAVGVRRTVGEIATLLTEREQRFADLGIDSMSSYRQRRSSAGLGAGNDPFGDVFLVVDGWLTLRKEYEELEPVITDIATRGLSYGIHVVTTATRWMDFRPGIRDLFGSRLELRLGDPTDSMVNRRSAANVPEKPGRGIVEHPTDKNKSLHVLTVRPELSTLPDTATLVKQIATSWTGPVAPRVRLLPASLPYAELDLDRSTGLRLPIGISESDLQPVDIDFGGDPHFLLFGDAECGKSSFLRALATTVTRRFTPEQARIILVDYRRSLMDLPESEHRIGYGMQAAKTLELMESVAGYMQRRLPGPDVTAQQLRERSWWQGPELFTLVDDYDLVVSGPTNPLQPLLEYLPQARTWGCTW